MFSTQDVQEVAFEYIRTGHGKKKEKKKKTLWCRTSPSRSYRNYLWRRRGWRAARSIQRSHSFRVLSPGGRQQYGRFSESNLFTYTFQFYPICFGCVPVRFRFDSRLVPFRFRFGSVWFWCEMRGAWGDGTVRERSPGEVCVVHISHKQVPTSLIPGVCVIVFAAGGLLRSVPEEAPASLVSHAGITSEALLAVQSDEE